MRALPRQCTRIFPANSTRPSTAPSSVLLPAPFGPTRRWTVPAATSSVTSDSTRRPSRATVSSRISSRTGAGIHSLVGVGHERLDHGVDVLMHLGLELLGRI